MLSYNALKYIIFTEKKYVFQYSLYLKMILALVTIQRYLHKNYKSCKCKMFDNVDVSRIILEKWVMTEQ